MQNPDIQKAYAYCEGVTKLHAKSFYFAAKFLPKYKQRAVFPIYAFCRHVDDEIDELGERNEQEAIAAVERWRINLEQIYQVKRKKEKGKTENRKPNTENQNKVFLAWQDLLKSYKIRREIPLDLVKGVLMDTTTKRYESFEELYLYCYRVASTVGLMSSEILGYSEEVALEYAEALGIGMQLTNILRDVREDAGRGRIYLPREDLRKFGVSEEQILANEFDANFRELMKFQIARARNFYAEGEKGIPLLEKDSRFCVLFASRIYGRILDEIERQDHDPFRGRAHTTKRQKLFSIPKIWREARNL